MTDGDVTVLTLVYIELCYTIAETIGQLRVGVVIYDKQSTIIVQFLFYRCISCTLHEYDWHDTATEMLRLYYNQ